MKVVLGDFSDREAGRHKTRRPSAAGLTVPLVTLRQYDASEDEASLKLIELAPKIDVMHSRYDTSVTLPSGCPLVGDDRWTEPYPLSHAAWHCVSVAVDQLHMFRKATVTGDHPNYAVTTRPHGAWALLRGVVENAASTTWLLRPDSRTERVTRLLRIRLQDARHHDEVLERMGAEVRKFPEREQWVAQVASAHGLDLRMCRRRPTYSEQVEGASVDGNAGLVFWKLLSGLAHGQWWATAVTGHMEELGTTPDGKRLNMRITTSTARLALYAEVAAGFVAQAYEMWDQRKTPYAP